MKGNTVQCSKAPRDTALVHEPTFHLKTLHDVRMSAVQAATAASGVSAECRLWAVRKSAIWIDLRRSSNRSDGGNVSLAEARTGFAYT